MNNYVSGYLQILLLGSFEIVRCLAFPGRDYTSHQRTPLEVRKDEERRTLSGILQREKCLFSIILFLSNILFEKKMFYKISVKITAFIVRNDIFIITQ